MNPTLPNPQSSPDPLAGLRDIHLPPAPGWWPPAPGWWLIALFLLTLTLFILYKWHRRRLRQRPIKLALTELARLDLKSTDPIRKTEVLQELSALLRRFSIVFFPQKAVAGLCGQAWLDFLKEEFAQAGTKKQFSDQDLLPLIEESYAPQSDTDLEALGRIVADWFSAQKKKTRERP
ncbi:MAG: DUF4381 domain-containing protein [Deltaproteobacteria bacterium]|nr:DUF4381 domain-containing protein [Deltaproteobacteria bacterium]